MSYYDRWSSSNMSPVLGLSRRILETPFEKRVHEQGAKSFTVYNQMPLATCFQSFEADYWHLLEHVQIWDVACERQVEVRGPDALRLVELSTPRDVSKCRIGQCIYAPLCNQLGGIINDPLVLRLAEDRFWISIADSGVLLWLQGLAIGRDFDVEVFDPVVAPCALQGPKADTVLTSVLGRDSRDIGFFRFIETTIAGTRVIVARSGWSGRGGFEIYLQDFKKGLGLWDEIWRHGEAHNIRAGCPNLIERIEAGLLSYGNDMTVDNNIFEIGLDRFVKLGKSAEYLSRAALDRVVNAGVRIKHVKIEVDGDPITPLRSTWPIECGGKPGGIVTSIAWSPRLKTNIANALVPVANTKVGTVFGIAVAGESTLRAAVVVNGWS